MKKNVLIRRITLSSAAMCLAIMVSGAGAVYPEPGTNDAALPPENGDSAVPGREKNGFPPYIATGIKVQAVHNVKGAARITWNVDPQAVGEFIVGRSKTVMDTGEKAISAALVKVVGPGSENSVIDTNLPPGEYYYVVLSREKVAEGKVEVYPNVNYSTVPVMIEQEAPSIPVRTNPDQVTLIHAQLTNRTHVVITWKGVDAPDIIYTVYRGTEQLSSPEKIRNADKLAVIADKREIFIDRSIVKTGTYYYAVTTRNVAGNEDLQLVPEQSYLTGGITVVIRTPLYVRDLAVMPVEGAVRLTWTGVGQLAREYLVYRYYKPVNNAQRLAMATLIGRAGPDDESFTDRQAGSGSYYYAVLIRVDENTIDYTLLERQNCSMDPVSAGVKKEPIVEEVPEKEVGPEVKTEVKPKVEIRPVPEKKAPSAGNVDAIVKNTFFRERYRAAIKKLEVVAQSSDNKLEVAKARLFIGRSLVELKRYSESIRYFIDPDVKKHFPAEAKFWREYAISRVRE